MCKGLQRVFNVLYAFNDTHNVCKQFHIKISSWNILLCIYPPLLPQWSHRSQRIQSNKLPNVIVFIHIRYTFTWLDLLTKNEKKMHIKTPSKMVIFQTLSQSFKKTVKGTRIFTWKVQKIHFLQSVNYRYLILENLRHTPVSWLFPTLVLLLDENMHLLALTTFEIYQHSFVDV